MGPKKSLRIARGHAPCALDLEAGQCPKRDHPRKARRDFPEIVHAVISTISSA
jgi:hypothetical protein